MTPKTMSDDDAGEFQPHTPLASILTHLCDISLELSNTELSELSDLNADEIKEFEVVWNALPPERKCQILARLEELTKNTVELNFDRIYRSSLYCIDDSVRRAAVEGLWENTNPSLLPPLLRLVQHDPAIEVRSAAAIALGRFSMMAEHQKISAENRMHLSQVLLEIIRNSAEPLEVRRRALEAIAPLSMPDITQSIWEAYRGQEQRMRVSSIYAMGRNCDQLWLPTVLKEMNSTEAEMRYEAAVAAGELGETAAVPQLIELTTDPDAEVQMAAVLALGKIGGKEAKQQLTSLRSHKSQAMRDAAEQSISEIDTLGVPATTLPYEFDEQYTN
ncbi:MAG: HEAT repeat domain-containing protein [Dehalococcoidia bacterium]|nr:HEAT repeat domain-containing protein [Dehalococcoidia bacterium]